MTGGRRSLWEPVFSRELVPSPGASGLEWWLLVLSFWRHRIWSDIQAEGPSPSAVFLSRGPRCELCLLSSLSFSPWASPLQWDPQLLGQTLRLYSCNQGILEQGGVWACVLRLRCGAPCGKCLGSSPSPLLACWVALRITYLTALCLRALICGLRIVVTTPKIK